MEMVLALVVLFWEELRGVVLELRGVVLELRGVVLELEEVSFFSSLSAVCCRMRFSSWICWGVSISSASMRLKSLLPAAVKSSATFSVSVHRRLCLLRDNGCVDFLFVEFCGESGCLFDVFFDDFLLARGDKLLLNPAGIGARLELDRFGHVCGLGGGGGGVGGGGGSGGKCGSVECWLWNEDARSGTGGGVLCLSDGNGSPND